MVTVIRMLRKRVWLIPVLILLAAALACSVPLGGDGGSGDTGDGGETDGGSKEQTEEPEETQEEAAVGDAKPTSTPETPGSARAITAANAANLVILRYGEVSTTALLGAAASPVAREFATYGFDKIVRIWTVDDGTVKFEAPATADFGFGLAYSPDGSKVAATGGYHVYIFDTATAQLLSDTVVNSFAFRVVWSPDGSRLAVVGDGSSRIEFIDPATGALQSGETLSNPEGRVLWAIAYSPDGQLVATSDDRGKVTVLKPSGEIVFEDPATTRGATWDLEFSPDGSLLASCNANGGVFVYDTSNWSIVLSGDALFAGGCTDGTFSVNSDVYFAAGADGSVLGWDISAGGNPLVELTFAVQVWMIGMSGDGEFMVVAIDDGTAGIIGLPE